MAEKKPSPKSISCRLSYFLRNKCDKLVESGDYADITEVVEAALHYYLSRQALRQDIFHSVVEQITYTLDEKFKEKDRSPENREYWLNIVKDVVEECIDQKLYSGNNSDKKEYFRALVKEAVVEAVSEIYPEIMKNQNAGELK